MTTGLERGTLSAGGRVQPTRVQRYHGRHVRRRQTRLSRELPLLVLSAFLLAVLVKGFLVQAFFIPSRSMEPTLDVGDRVVVNRLAYRFGEPQHGQVVVFVRQTGNKPPPAQGPLSWMRHAVAQWPPGGRAVPAAPHLHLRFRAGESQTRALLGNGRQPRGFGRFPILRPDTPDRPGRPCLHQGLAGQPRRWALTPRQRQPAPARSLGKPSLPRGVVEHQASTQSSYGCLVAVRPQPKWRSGASFPPRYIC